MKAVSERSWEELSVNGGGCSRCGAVLFHPGYTTKPPWGYPVSSFVLGWDITEAFWIVLYFRACMAWLGFFFIQLQLQLQFVVEMLLNLTVLYYITTAYHGDGHSYNLSKRIDPRKQIKYSAPARVSLHLIILG